MDQWREACKDLFRDCHDIHNPEELGLAKFDGATFNADTCYGASLTSEKLLAKVKDAVKEVVTIEEGERFIMLFWQDCHQHLRNV